MPVRNAWNVYSDHLRSLFSGQQSWHFVEYKTMHLLILGLLAGMNVASHAHAIVVVHL